MTFGEGFHSWAQTVSAIVQALAVVFGIGFAVYQISEQQGADRQRRVEATLDRLHELDTEPLRASYDFVYQAANILNPPPTTEDFIRQTTPFGNFISGITICVTDGVCDRATTIERMCPAYTHYLEGAVRVGTMVEEREAWDQLRFNDLAHFTTMQTICASDERYFETMWNLMRKSVAIAEGEWKKAAHPDTLQDPKP